MVAINTSCVSCDVDRLSLHCHTSTNSRNEHFRIWIVIAMIVGTDVFFSLTDTQVLDAVLDEMCEFFEHSFMRWNMLISHELNVLVHGEETEKR